MECSYTPGASIFAIFSKYLLKSLWRQQQQQQQQDSQKSYFGEFMLRKLSVKQTKIYKHRYSQSIIPIIENFKLTKIATTEEYLNNLYSSTC